MKILLITGSLNQGGAEFQILSLERLLSKKGYYVEVVAITDYNYYLPFIRKNNIRYSCVPNEGSNLKRLIRAVRLINSKKPDLAISYLKRVSQVAILARCLSFFRYKLLISERTSQIQPLHDLFYFNLAVLANRLIINSISKYKHINRKFPLVRNKTVFIPNIIDVAKLCEVNRQEAPDGLTRLTYVGRISPEKNLINLTLAIKILVDNGFLVTLSLCGESNNKRYFEELRSLIDKLDLTKNISYIGTVDDITEIYRQTDLLCLVSFYEGFSNVLAEAISCGIPVVTSNIEENRYLVNEKENGFLVDPCHPESIANGIGEFLKLPDTEKSAISENNRKKAQVSFDEEKVFSQFNKVFLEVNGAAN